MKDDDYNRIKGAFANVRLSSKVKLTPGDIVLTKDLGEATWSLRRVTAAGSGMLAFDDGKIEPWDGTETAILVEAPPVTR